MAIPALNEENKNVLSRYGKIVLLKDAGISPEIYSEAFSQIQFFPITIQEAKLFNEKEYYGYSPLFDVLEEGKEIPKYYIEAQKFVDKPTEYHVKRNTWKQGDSLKHV